MSKATTSPQARIPSVDRILRMPAVEALIKAYGRPAVTDNAHQLKHTGVIGNMIEKTPVVFGGLLELAVLMVLDRAADILAERFPAIGRPAIGTRSAIKVGPFDPSSVFARRAAPFLSVHGGTPSLKPAQQTRRGLRPRTKLKTRRLYQ